MAHLPYADLRDPADPAVMPLVERIVAERGELLHLYQMLLHSPPLADGWLYYLTRVRQQLSLPGALRELAIVQVAHLNGASYEAAQHLPIARREGVDDAALAALPDWQARPELFSEAQRLALELTDTMTRAVQVPPALMARVREALGERQAVELAGVIAAYNMVSRFLEATGIHAHDAG
ncbi:carboxymuconolactone decarboxylase family protein [Piscinibacter sakaiensis]|uniref:Putative membrane protein n=1 Tax=Piscinibacter sakaiensis TaxID=1547922 RepID=A0A0K8NVP5_PISS1|nr:carboxymuconolactone decarboxylase family protein [Piscinibacter sakaiensis]GAP34349.1 putative membrane protein [Piscinibacter sakaiensis]